METFQETLPHTIDASALLTALIALKKGDFSVRLPVEWTGVAGKVADSFNDVVELNDRMTKEFERLGETVGRQGKINHRARLPAAQGSWAASVDAVNTLIADPARAKTFGKAGRRRAVESFAWPAIAEQTSQLYRSLV